MVDISAMENRDFFDSPPRIRGLIRLQHAECDVQFVFLHLFASNLRIDISSMGFSCLFCMEPIVQFDKYISYLEPA